MTKHFPILLAMAMVIGLPFALRPKQRAVFDPAGETLVVITPHNEAIRHEFGRAFARHLKESTGRNVRVDWRVPGGTSEIARYLAAQYQGAFRHYWEQTLRRPWTDAVRAGFDNPRVTPGADPAADTPEMAARRSFLDSNVGIGIDLFFGGGSYDFGIQAAAGRLVDSGFTARHPNLFNATNIPASLGGAVFWDEAGRWVGACLSSFGLCWNEDVLRLCGLDRTPSQWSDLADPALAGRIALADPTKSGSAAKAFEMLVQQQMRQAGDPARGWADAMRLIQRIGANARYFTEYSPSVVLDLTYGDAAAGMTIDFYGRFQSEAVRQPEGASRVGYLTPVGGSTVDTDPIGLLRGAPHRALALEFIDFVLSVDGQKLWNFKVGEPGGPEQYALRRLPIRRELYAPEFQLHVSDPAVRPYEDAAKFAYRPEWTGALVRPLGFVVRVMCLDTEPELREAWRALIAAGFPPEATAAFADVSAVDYAAVTGPVRSALASPDKLAQVRLAKQLGDRFRANYRQAAQLARAGR